MKSDGSTCATALGSCENKKCSSSCTEKVQEESIKIEEVVDAVLKNWVENHLHGYLRDHLSSPVARQIEETLIDAINVDLVPRLSIIQEEGKSAFDEKEIQSPSI